MSGRNRRHQMPLPTRRNIQIETDTNTDSPFSSASSTTTNSQHYAARQMLNLHHLRHNDVHTPSPNIYDSNDSRQGSISDDYSPQTSNTSR